MDILLKLKKKLIIIAQKRLNSFHLICDTSKIHIPHKIFNFCQFYVVYFKNRLNFFKNYHVDPKKYIILKSFI